MAFLSDPEGREKRFAEMRARVEARNHPQEKDRMHTREQLSPYHPIFRDLARLSFHRENRTIAHVKAVALKHNTTVKTVYEKLRIYEQTHTLSFPSRNYWDEMMAKASIGVVGNGNRRVGPRVRGLV